MPKKLKGGTFWDFSTSIVAKFQKIEGGSFGEFFPKKSLTIPKKTERGFVPFSLVRYCMLRGKPFRFSFLGEQQQYKTL